MSADLREALNEITNSGRCCICEHAQEFEALRKRLPHAISLFEKEFPIPHNCFQYAFGIAQSDVIHRMLTQDRFRQTNRKPHTDVKVGTEFVAKMIAAGMLVANPNGKIILYFDDKGEPKHAGIALGQRVISKWGSGYAWNHDVWEVPATYGTRAERFDLKATTPEIERLFQEYAARLPTISPS